MIIDKDYKLEININLNLKIVGKNQKILSILMLCYAKKIFFLLFKKEYI